MSKGSPKSLKRKDLDRSLLRLYDRLGEADTHRAIVAALTPEIELILGYRSIWMQLVRQDSNDLLTLDSGGPVIEVMKTLLQDERFRLTMHGEDFVVVPIGDDGWLHEIIDLGDIHVTEDARLHPLTNKELLKLTGQRTVVCVPLPLAERTLGFLSMGTFFDEGARMPDGAQLDYLRRLAPHIAVALDRVRFLGERREARDALVQSLQELRFSSFLLDSVMDGVIVGDFDDGRVLYANDAICRLTGRSREELLSSREANWARTEDRSAVKRHMASVRKTGRGELEAVSGSGDGPPLQLRSSVVEYIDRKAILTVVNDISERRAAQAAIEYMALHDPLTQLANRALLRDRLEIAVAHARRKNQPLALLFIDVDDFKVINDTAGHAAGDLVLQEIARRLRGLVRADDTVARYGGDEFTLVLPDVGTTDDACRVAAKIVASLRGPYEADAVLVSASASVGVVVYECDDITTDELLRNADMAMYCAKDEGRDAYRLYDPSMKERVIERYRLVRDLEDAISTRALELHFQPIVRLTDGTILGGEALCRWTHPERGPISPVVFIPLAEESGAICDLGEWVLREACAQASRWQRPGRGLSVSVNLSPQQLYDCDLSQLVIETLDETGLPPNLLQLEITETAAMRDAPHLAGAFGVLRGMGVRIAIDDFGTGYSSLDYLMRFPVDTLKVDRSFVRNVAGDQGSRAIASAVVSMARALGLDTIAEGVETEEQRQTLISSDCPHGQGFLFSPGIPAEDFLHLVHTKRRCFDTYAHRTRTRARPCDTSARATPR